MKRLHVHMSVKDLSESIRFYSKLFGVEPAVTKSDYAKWILDDPRINFAISDCGGSIGINHLGLQVDSDEELQVMRAQAAQAGMDAIDEKGVSCCYARSDKYWIEDPQGIAWETFHSLGGIPIHDEDRHIQTDSQDTCCGSPAEKPGTVTEAMCCGSDAKSDPAKAACCA